MGIYNLWTFDFPSFPFYTFSSSDPSRYMQRSNTKPLIKITVIFLLEWLSPSVYQRVDMISLSNMSSKSLKVSVNCQHEVCQTRMLPSGRKQKTSRVIKSSETLITQGSNTLIWVTRPDCHKMWKYKTGVSAEALKGGMDIPLFPKEV